MADGLNDARAMRVAEVMNDFQSLQHRISQYQSVIANEHSQEVGFSILRRCHADAQAVLAQPFDGSALEAPSSTGEQTKRQLRRVLVDASARRFKTHKIYLRAAAAMRWVSRRNQILQGQKPSQSHDQALQQARNTLDSELNAITNQRVFNELSAKDNAAGNWTAEMPDLNTLRAYINA